VLTDNGIQFIHRKQDKQAFEHLFDRVCREHAIEHRLTDATQLDVGIITAEDGKSQLYMVTFRRRHTRALVDPETGEIIFEATYFSGPDVGMNRPGEDLNEKGALYKEVENLFRKKVSKDAIIFAIYRKMRAKDGKRFFEVFLQKPEEGDDIYGLTSYLFDIKTEKVLYKTEAHVTLIHSSTPTSTSSTNMNNISKWSKRKSTEEARVYSRDKLRHGVYLRTKGAKRP
jgi:hypothetical protein